MTDLEMEQLKKIQHDMQYDYQAVTRDWIKILLATVAVTAAVATAFFKFL